MFREKCKNCRMRLTCRNSALGWIFFLIGLIATVSMRVIEPLRIIDTVYAKLAWYVGVAGFFLFFLYKYKALVDRSKVIKQSRLDEKIASSSRLSQEDYKTLSEMLCSQDNWMERTNFQVIFILSAVALALALWNDLL